MNCVCQPQVSFTATPAKLPVTRLRRLVLLLQRKDTSGIELTDRRIGLNMNYSIIFTEITFSRETSILFEIIKIIRIIHMTIWIIPESDRDLRAVPSWGLLPPPPPKKEEVIKSVCPSSTLGAQLFIYNSIEELSQGS